MEPRTKTASLQEQRQFVKKGKLPVLIAFFLLFSFFFLPSANAQCAMCRAAIESEGDVAKAEAVNDGIVYLMVIPYLIVGAVAFGVYKLRQSKTT